MGWLVSLALLLHIIFVFTDQGYRWLLSAIRCCVADVTAFIVTMIYWFRMTTATGKNTSQKKKRARRWWRGATECQLLRQLSSPLPLRTAHFASGYCLAICCISTTLTTTAKQTWSLCQMPSPSFCPSNSTPLGFLHLDQAELIHLRNFCIYKY